MRKWAFKAAAVLIPLVAGLAFLSWLCGPDSIGPAKYHGIQLGMTADAVEALFGLPAGNHFTGTRKRSWDWRGPLWFLEESVGLPLEEFSRRSFLRDQGADPLVRKTWNGGTYKIDVGFDLECRVVGVYLWRVSDARTPATLLDHLRGWFNL